MATGTDVSGFAGGAVLYQFGFTGVQRKSVTITQQTPP